MTFRIAFIDVLGLSYDGATLSKRGLGGSESAVILMSRELVKLGFEVTVFNDCVTDDTSPGVYDGVTYKPLSEAEFDNKYHIVISSRSVAPFDWHQKSGKYKSGLPLPDFTHIVNNARWRVLWMHDTFCDGDDLIESLCISGRLNEVFVLSDFHLSYVTNCSHGQKRMFEVLKHHMYVTRNGVTQYIDEVDIAAKDPNLFVYNASVTKGMIPLVTKIWPAFKARNPDAKLTVIGGYYRFRSTSEPDEQENKWRELVEKYKNDVNFTGIISQQEIANILAKASYTIYPAAFPETFGISTLESLTYNTPVITCDFGALEETAIDIASYKIPYPIESNNLFPHINDEQQEAAFLSTAEIAYKDKYLHQQLSYACNQVKGINTWDTVALQWKQHFCHVLEVPLPVDEYRKASMINQRVREVFGRRFINKEELIIPLQGPEYPLTIITPVYNAENYVAKTILSIAQQDYDNYNVFLIDDASTDNTRNVIEATLETLPEHISKRFKLFNNESNMGAIHNQAMVLDTMDNWDDRAIMLIDGDDWLDWDPQIFKKFSNLYNQGAQFTYGSCWSVADNIPLIAQPYPQEVKRNKTYRQHKFNWNIPYTHLRTFRSDLIDENLFKALKDEDGNYFRAGGDVALFYELIERADPDKVICMTDVVYNYNDANPINDYKVNSDEQQRNAKRAMNNAKKKVLIAIPTAKYIESQTFKSIYDLIIPDDVETTFQFFYGYRVDQVRNLIADWAVKGYDYLFAVDHDITFPPDTLVKLLSHDKPIVSGIYRQRVPEMVLEVYDSNYRNIPVSDIKPALFEIGACGFGCVLVKSEVLRRIKYPQFEYHQALDHKNTFSEDVDFCKKAKEAGFTLWADSTIRCGHIGSTTYELSIPGPPPFDPNARLRELSDTRLLPQAHIDMLNNVKSNLGVKPKVIFDIGACVLHWTKEADKVWPDAEIVMIEAMTEVKFLYDEYLRNRKGNYVVGALLTDKDNELVRFNKNVEHPGGNSMYKENPEYSPLAEQLFPESNTVMYNSVTLDTLVKNYNLPQPDLIKMDIQGAELLALKGAQETLKKTKYLILELQHVDYNIGAPKHQEVKRYLEDIGFEETYVAHGSELSVDADYFFTRVRDAV